MAARDPRSLQTVILLCCATLTVMAGATIAPSLPGLQRHFAGLPNAPALVPLILTVPGLAIALMSPVAGLIVDRTRKRRVLLTGIVLYILAGSSGLYLDAIGQIMIGRALLGVAVACVMTSSVALLAGLYSDEERGTILGYQAAAMSFGSVIFIMTGGFLADISWRGPFAVYLAPIILLPLVSLFIARGDPIANCATDAGAQDGRFPWQIALIIYLATFANFLIYFTIPIKLPFALNAMGVESATLAGGAIATLTFASGIIALGFGRIRPLASPAMIAAVSFALCAIGFGLLATLPPVPAIFALMIFIGLASGVILPNATTWLYAHVPPDMRGRAAGYMTMSVFTAQFLSAPAVSFLEAAGGLSLIYAAAALTAFGACLFFATVAVLQRRPPVTHAR